MNYLIILVVFVLVFQIAIFFLIRYKKKIDKEENVLIKYNIKTAGDAWKLLNDPSIPEEDRKKIEEIYQEKST